MDFLLSKFDFLSILEKLEDRELATQIKDYTQEIEVMEAETLYIPNKEEYLIYLLKRLDKYSEMKQKYFNIVVEKLNILGSRNLNIIEIEKLKSHVFAVFSSLIEKINTLETRIQILEGVKEIEKLKAEIKDHDRNTLNIMGIFLSIFSLIGVNLSFFTNFESNSIISWIFLIIVVNLTLLFVVITLLLCIKFLFMKDFSEIKNFFKSNK